MSKNSIRNTIGEYMLTLGERDKEIIVVNADLAGTSRNREFTDRFPDRSFNVGIAEQNMVSFAAGLACEGFRPYVFSMAPFLTMRACEQCRTDVAYGNKNVKMVGVYAGVSGGISGATHWGIEDVGIMTSIPNIAVFEVSDSNMAKKVMDFSLEYEKPMYIRCTVEPVEDFYDESTEVRLGGANEVNAGDDGAFLCSGVVVQYALEAARKIRKEMGISIRVVDMYSIKPIDKSAVISAAKTGKVVVAQDHNIFGGLGSAVAQVIVEAGIATKMITLGIPDSFVPMAHAPYLFKEFHYDAEGLTETMKSML